MAPTNRSKRGRRGRPKASAGRLDRRFLETTRGRVLVLLRRSSRTVEELAAELNVTDNAVRAHLLALERDGLVVQRGVRRGLRKPAYSYQLTPDAERLFRQAHSAVLQELLDKLVERLQPEELRSVLHDVGRGLAGEIDEDRPPADRLRDAVHVLNDLGGLAELEEEAGAPVIRGYSCPLGDLVTAHPEVCALAEALVAEIAGQPVRECCDRGERPACRFELVAEQPRER